MGKRYWCDFSASILLEGNSEKDIKQEFWKFIDGLECVNTNIDYVEINCIEEESEEN